MGVDGSLQSLEAVRQAAREAGWRGRPLHIVHAFSWPVLGVAAGPPVGAPPGTGLRHDAEQMLAAAEGEARDTSPGLAVVTHLQPGLPVPVLLEFASRAASAELIVLGGRGLGALTGVLIGSVTAQVSARSPVPVLVCKGFAADEGPVVAGVDTSGWASLVLEHAHAEAHWRGAGLHAVRCVPRPSAIPGEMAPLEPEAYADPDRLSDKQLAAFGERYPDVEVQAELLREEPAKALRDLSDGAQLVVVGSRGAGALSGLFLGSVSRQVLFHARCPVLVVRHPR